MKTRVIESRIMSFKNKNLEEFSSDLLLSSRRQSCMTMKKLHSIYDSRYLIARINQVSDNRGDSKIVKRIGQNRYALSNTLVPVPQETRSYCMRG